MSKFQALTVLSSPPENMYALPFISTYSSAFILPVCISFQSVLKTGGYKLPFSALKTPILYSTLGNYFYCSWFVTAKNIASPISSKDLEMVTSPSVFIVWSKPNPKVGKVNSKLYFLSPQTKIACYPPNLHRAALVNLPMAWVYYYGKTCSFLRLKLTPAKLWSCLHWVIVQLPCLNLWQSFDFYPPGDWFG